MDDVLSLFQSDEEESEFSGFEQLEAMPVSTELTRTHKADVAKGPDVVGPKKKGKSKEKTSTKKATVVLPGSSSCSASANLPVRKGPAGIQVNLNTWNLKKITGGFFSPSH